MKIVRNLNAISKSSNIILETSFTFEYFRDVIFRNTHCLTLQISDLPRLDMFIFEMYDGFSIHQHKFFTFLIHVFVFLCPNKYLIIIIHLVKIIFIKNMLQE